MLISWWWLWMVFMFIFLVPPVGYGWAYRGWGPPYPRYLQRRRAQRAASTNGSTPFDHHAWGRGGDFVWVVCLVGMLWIVVGVWGRWR
jgi:hypothetical protein